MGYSDAGNTVNAQPLLSQEIHRQFLQVPGQSTFDQPITYIISCVLLAKVALLRMCHEFAAPEFLRLQSGAFLSLLLCKVCRVLVLRVLYSIFVIGSILSEKIVTKETEEKVLV